MSDLANKVADVGITNAFGHAELEILNILWQMGDATVRQTYDEVRKNRDITLPAVMLSMERLTKRGVLRKSPGTRAAVYSPLLTRENIGYSLLSDVIDRVMQGSTGAVVSHLVNRLSKDELEEIASRISDIQE